MFNKIELIWSILIWLANFYTYGRHTNGWQGQPVCLARFIEMGWGAMRQRCRPVDHLSVDHLSVEHITVSQIFSSWENCQAAFRFLSLDICAAILCCYCFASDYQSLHPIQGFRNINWCKITTYNTVYNRRDRGPIPMWAISSLLKPRWML